MFKDKVYEDMDDVTRIFEPFEYALNCELSQFPDKIELTSEDLLRERMFDSFGASATDIVIAKARELKLNNISAYAYDLQKTNFFKFEIEGGEGEAVTLDGTTMQLSNKIFLVKSKLAYDEKELEDLRRREMANFIKGGLYSKVDVNKPRLNELADLYGAKDVKSERSYRVKVDKFIEHLEKMVDDKVLDIRDMSLCDKFNLWVVDYIKDGNLAALNNLTRIKIMTHQKRPIYSIEEKV